MYSTWSLVGRTMLSPTAAWIVSISKTFSYWADKVAFSVWSVVSWFWRDTTSPFRAVNWAKLVMSRAAKTATAMNPTTAKGAT